MKIAVYTVMMDGVWTIKPIDPIFYSEADYFLITNMDIDIDTEPYVIKRTDIFDDPIKESRRYKMLSHEFFAEYDYSIYMDASMVLLESPVKLVQKYLKLHDMAVFKHPDRSCIYEEAAACLSLAAGSPEIINEQVEFLKKEEYPPNNGLTANGILIRKHTQQIKEFNELWWKIFSMFPSRDQLNFCYCIWKGGIDYCYIDPPDNGVVNKTTEFELRRE